MTVRGDIISGDWDGDDPADLSSVDAGATAGFYLDSSQGAGQFMGDMFLGGDLYLLDGGSVTILDDGGSPVGSFTFSGGTSSAHFSDDLFVAGVITGSGQAVFTSNGLTTNFIEAGSALTINLGDSGQGDTDGLILQTYSGGTSHVLTIRGATTAGTPVVLAYQDLSNEWWFQAGLAGSSYTKFGNYGIRTTNGSASAPSLSFLGDTNTGIYWVSADVLGVSTGGVVRARVDSTGVKLDTGSSERFGWAGDPDTYIERSAANVLQLVTGGSQAMQWGSAVTSTAIRDATTGSAANGFVNASSGVLGRSTSLAAHKNNIRPWMVTDNEWDALASHEWESKLAGEEGETFRGFVWDYLPERFRAEENEDLRVIVGALIQRVKLLEAA